jgi:hypothetical protein
MDTTVRELMSEVENLKQMIDLALENIAEENLGDYETVDDLALHELDMVVEKIHNRIVGSYEKNGNDGIRAKFSRVFRERGF